VQGLPVAIPTPEAVVPAPWPTVEPVCQQPDAQPAPIQYKPQPAPAQPVIVHVNQVNTNQVAVAVGGRRGHGLMWWLFFGWYGWMLGYGWLWGRRKSGGSATIINR
jgi:hypothetical protein